MSSNSQLDTSSLQFQAIFDAALNEYSQKTGKDIITDPLTAKLRCCTSPDAVLNILQEEAQAFNDFRNGNRKVPLMRKLKPTVDILLALSNSGVLGSGVVTFPPACAILAGIGILLAAAKRVSTSYDALIDLFECFENYLSRLRILSEIPPAMKGVLVKIMVELLAVLALATQQIKQGRLKKFAKKILGENDVEAVLQRLDRLTMEESRMTVAQTMEVVHGLFANMKVVMDDGKTSTDSIREVLVTIQEIAESVNKMKRDELQKGFRQWLSPPDPSINHNTAFGVHHKVTASWFTDGAVYTEWKARGSLLWVYGKPGSGKSVFCSSIIKDIEDARKAGLASLAYYYFDFKDSQKQDRRGLLSSLLLQLSARSDAFCDILAQMHLTYDKGSRQPSESDLIDCLKEMLSIHGQGKVYIILDALDECSNNSGMPTSREEVLILLKNLTSLRLPHVHICVTSRPEVDIRTALEHLASHCVSLHEESGQRKDIIDYLSSVVESDPRMGKWREEDKQLVIDTLSRKADGMFRWVFCQLDTLRRCFPGSIRRALKELPRTLDETYERILLGIDEEKWEYALRLFQCLTVSRRPLDVQELAEVLAVELDAGAIPKLNVDLRPKNADEAVLSACSTLITIIKRNPDTISRLDDDQDDRALQVVQFSHYSVKEFLTSGRLESSRPTLSRFYISPQPAHLILAQCCISTLLQLEPGMTNFPLARYAAINWVDHGQMYGVTSRIQTGMEFLFDPEKPHFANWVNLRKLILPWRYPKEPRSPLSYAALYGFDHLVKHLVITRRHDPNTPDPDSRTPLQAAVRGKNHAIVQFLLEHGADPNCRDPENRTLLHEAAIKGHPDVAQLLLNSGVDTRALDDAGDSPLHRALRYENLDVLRVLLQQGADVNTRDVGEGTPLHRASECGSVNAVKLLLNYGADMKARDNQRASPLHRASLYGNFDIVQLLLNCGAEANSQDCRGFAPLHEASRMGGLEVINLLLGCGAAMMAGDDQGASPLHVASRYGKFDVVQLFLENSMDVNVPDSSGSTPLHQASIYGHLHIVQRLIDSGANIMVSDNQGASPLHEASRYGNAHVVQLLLKYSADANTRDGEGSTPLHQASAFGHLDVVQQLIDVGANITVGDNQGLSPLHKASLHGNVHVVQLLLQYRADMNTREDNGSTPLHQASRRGHVKVVEELLRWGACVDARDRDCSTPLCEASLHGHTKVVELLLEGRADVDARKNGYRTSLHVVVEKKDFDLAWLLLAYGADPNARDERGWTPLHLASTCGHIPVVNLLLDRGANVNSQEGDRRTALHLAAFSGHADMARWLMTHGADPHLRDNHGRTPFSIALETGNRKVARLLSDWVS